MMRSKSSVLQEMMQNLPNANRHYAVEIMESKRIILPTLPIQSPSDSLEK